MKLGWQCTYMCIVCSGEEAEQVACRHLDKFRCCWSCFSKLDVQLSEDVSWSMKRLSTCLEIASLALASTLCARHGCRIGQVGQRRTVVLIFSSVS